MKKFMPKHGTTRVIKRFAISPIIIENEYRWLEIVKIKQEYFDHTWFSPAGKWVNISFEDK